MRDCSAVRPIQSHNSETRRLYIEPDLSAEEQLQHTILYVDDEAACLALLQARFGDEYDVRTASTIDEARQMLSLRAADIVISDQSMPEMKGTDFLDEVARNYPRSYRVLLTGSIAFSGVMPEIGDGTVHFFLPKPWTEASMLQMFERAAVHIERRREGER